jgi:hypothetical protein
LKLAGADRESEIRYARFLIKAGLAKVAVDSLRKIVAESPGTRAAQEAQQILDSIAKTGTKAPSPPAAPHVAAASTTPHSVSNSADHKPASSDLRTSPTPSKATRPPVQHLDVVSASGSVTVTAGKISPLQPPPTNPHPPQSLSHVDAGTVPSNAATLVNSMSPIVEGPIAPTGDTRPDEKALAATNTGSTASRIHDEQRLLSENRSVTPEPQRINSGPVNPDTYDPQAHIVLENARYWIERKHKNWARGLLVKFIIHHPDSEQGETAKRMLKELDQ